MAAVRDVPDVFRHAAAEVDHETRGAAAARPPLWPAAKNFTVCGLPSSTISKSSAVSPVDRLARSCR